MKSTLQQATTSSPSGDPTSNGGRLRILLLEDVAMDAELIEYQLGRAGIAFTPRCVDNRDDFVVAIGEFCPDLILSDYALPGFDGMSALRLARELAPATPFIIVTGSINEEIAVDCMRAGAADYLLKNNLARMGPAIEAAIERARAWAQTRAAEEALRRSEANLRAIFHNTLQDFVLLDRDGVIQTMNKPSSDWTRWLVGSDVTEGESLRERMPEQMVAEFDDMFARALNNEVVTVERQLTDPTGAERWFEASLIPVVADGHSVIGVCISVANIDERKRAEDHLRRAEKMQAVGRLAGGVAHEVNNMMTVILGFGDFLLRSLGPDDPRSEEAKEIIRAAQRAASVTKQLLAFSRRQILQPRVLDLNGVVTGLQPIIDRTLGASHRFVMRLSPMLGTVRADRGQLEQVLVNLVLNARDAMADGGQLTIETSTVMLGEDYLRRRTEVKIPLGTYIMLAVSDTGHGMTPEVQARAFEPFFSTKPVGQGTGLGLSTVYGIVKQSGGYIWAYSERGIGTTFKIYLPVVHSPSDAVPEQVVPAAAGGNEAILVVEDEDIVRNLACRVLREQGYTVFEARQGHEGLECVAQHADELRLVLSDVVMPEMGGRELGRLLHELHPHLPVLYMSGYTGDDVVQRGLLDATAPFQQKPFSPDGLVRKVREMLDSRSAAPPH
jgi:two-component system, cell cycle sensor histidine kinase and response regulator CckA